MASEKHLIPSPEISSYMMCKELFCLFFNLGIVAHTFTPSRWRVPGQPGLQGEILPQEYFFLVFHGYIKKTINILLVDRKEGRTVVPDMCSSRASVGAASLMLLAQNFTSSSLFILVTSYPATNPDESSSVF